MFTKRPQPVDSDTISAMERIRDALRTGERDELDRVVAIELSHRSRSVEVANAASAAYVEIGDREAAALMLAFSIIVSGASPVTLAKVADRLRQRGFPDLGEVVSKGAR